MTASLYCPHDGTRLAPLEGTPNWFRCGAEGWKHYFYRAEAGELTDVDTGRPVPKEAFRPAGSGQPGARRYFTLPPRMDAPAE